jgi:hypothetical protein
MRELLATGLLEGQPVNKYIYHEERQGKEPTNPDNSRAKLIFGSS